MKFMWWLLISLGVMVTIFLWILIHYSNKNRKNWELDNCFINKEAIEKDLPEKRIWRYRGIILINNPKTNKGELGFYLYCEKGVYIDEDISPCHYLAVKVRDFEEKFISLRDVKKQEDQASQDAGGLSETQ